MAAGGKGDYKGAIEARVGRGVPRDVAWEEGQEVNRGASRRECRKMSSENSRRQAGPEHCSYTKCRTKVNEEGEHSTRDRRSAAWGSEAPQGLKAACATPSIRKAFRGEDRGAYCNDGLFS